MAWGGCNLAEACTLHSNKPDGSMTAVNFVDIGCALKIACIQ